MPIPLRLNRLLTALVFCLFTSACGQKGPLILPQQDQPVEAPANEASPPPQNQ